MFHYLTMWLLGYVHCVVTKNCIPFLNVCWAGEGREEGREGKRGEEREGEGRREGSKREGKKGEERGGEGRREGKEGREGREGKGRKKPKNLQMQSVCVCVWGGADDNLETIISKNKLCTTPAY